MWNTSNEGVGGTNGVEGLVFEGETQDHMRHGQGQLTCMLDGAELEEAVELLDVSKLGEEGWSVEEVLEKWGGRFVGGFQDDVPHGPALLFLNNGQSFALTLEHGKVIK